jgi:pimeloyl-ACP methyl ester carboxylesterase
MAKSVFHFGGLEAGLLGTLQTPARLQRRSAAVVLCNPLSEEANRAHRLYRVMAVQLERQGYASLRFDYRCTGDSAGDEANARLEDWVEDVATAASEAMQRAGVSRVVLCGVRLGATLATLAAASGHLRVRQLVLWDPVIEGRPYLRDLSETHVAFLREELVPHRAAMLRATDVPPEYLGMPLPASLSAAIGAIDLATTEPLADRINVIRTRQAAGQQRLEAAWRGRPGVSFTDVAAGENWNSDAALNAATVPAEVVRAITNCIEEHNP